ncbi:hypothetical protein ACA910_011137 [Epithemia clementina (nom. ined.)]
METIDERGSGTTSTDVRTTSQAAKNEKAHPNNNEAPDSFGVDMAVEDDDREKYVLVLISSKSSDPNVLENQKKALDELDANQIPFQVLDGSEPRNKAKCNKLFTLSGCRSFYPQFFQVVVVEKSSGSSTIDGDAASNINNSPFDEEAVEFWGDWFQFETTRNTKDGIAKEFRRRPSRKGQHQEGTNGRLGNYTNDKPSTNKVNHVETDSSESEHICTIYGGIVLILFTSIVLSIPLFLMFGHEEDRPKLIAWLDKNKDNLLVPPDWIESFNCDILGKDDEDFEAKYGSVSFNMGSAWYSPKTDKEFFSDIFRENLQQEQGREETQEEFALQSKRTDPFDWFDGIKTSIDLQHDNFFRAVAHFFRNSKKKKYSSPTDDGLRLEGMITKFLAQRTESAVEMGDRSLPQMISLFANASAEVSRQLNLTLGHVGLERFNLLQFLYFMEDEESRKNAVWKRRAHRYLAQLQTDAAIQLHDGLYLSQLAYAPSCDEIYRRLEAFRGGLWVLRNCTVEASLHQPAHFVVVRRLNPEKKMMDLLKEAWASESVFGTDFRRRQNSWSWLVGPSLYVTPKPQQLEMAMVVRGSKELFDFLTDGMLLATEYRGGKAHDGILKSAQWLEQVYQSDLKKFWRQSRKQAQGRSNRKKMKLWLIGHSLGGGTAALATMQFRGGSYTKWLDAEALGFGTPSLISPDLSYHYKDYITTVINDADAVPRLSGNVIAKAWLRIVAFNWTDAALNDYDQLVELMLKDQTLMSTIFGNKKSRMWFEESSGKIRQWLETWFDKNVAPWLKNLPTGAQGQHLVAEHEAELIPPGECIHLYRDGVSYQGSYMNCSYFGELEVVRHSVEDHLIVPGYHKAILGFVRDQLKHDSWVFDDDMLAIDYP